MSFLRRLLGKKHPPPPVEFNFKQRVEAFWRWFQENSCRFHQSIEAQRCGDLTDEVSTAVDQFLPCMAWVFGPGDKPGEHSFTLSGEGIEFKQMLALHWLKQAPRIDGWKFYAERQPADNPGDFSLRLEGELVFKVMEFWVTPEIDEENECVDLTVWHPLAEQADARHCQTALFLVLDEIFGEIGTGRWIGAMDFSPGKLAESMPILELKEFVDATQAERGWKLHHPCETWSCYRITEEKRRDALRFDIISGVTVCWKTLRDFLDQPDSFADPFGELAAEWVYLSFPTSVLPKGKEVDTREMMAEAIVQPLTQERSGTLLGGAIGYEHAYIDLLIFDGERSLQLIREAARSAGFPAATRLEFLDSKKRQTGTVLLCD
jgi:hypothetical protein